MTLQQYVAKMKRQILDDLSTGAAPGAGKYDEDLLESLRAKGEPQMGTSEFEPETVWLEFIFMTEGVADGVLRIELVSPERIVFMPVPEWVVEEVWQGEVDGSYHFEPDADRLIEEYSKKLTPLTNRDHFKKKKVIGRS